ncbi:MAG: ribosome assembly RNA-binding protein YhbY [Oscillospiraceae bacterium]|nr:ribosome assembly RNA-binding protein YhbY [Oscillospiraceae bacterium]
MLTGKQRAYLRSLAQKEDCILYVGKAGLSEPVIDQAREALEARELVKGKVQDACMYTAAEAQQLLCEACGAEGVQVIGRVFVLYKKSEKAAKIQLPKG